MSELYTFSAHTAGGDEVALSDYKDKVLLIVNTASKCGFTPQYDGLEQLQKDFHGEGFDVLAFPCNQFGKQEPGTEDQIVEFCTMTFNTSFPLFAKIEDIGGDAHPWYAWHKKQAPGVLGTGAIKWNFTKFLVDRQGNVIKRYGSSTTPAAIAKDIKALL